MFKDPCSPEPQGDGRSEPSASGRAALSNLPVTPLALAADEPPWGHLGASRETPPASEDGDLPKARRRPFRVSHVFVLRRSFCFAAPPETMRRLRELVRAGRAERRTPQGPLPAPRGQGQQDMAPPQLPGGWGGASLILQPPGLGQSLRRRPQSEPPGARACGVGGRWLPHEAKSRV